MIRKSDPNSSLCESDLIKMLTAALIPAQRLLMQHSTHFRASSIRAISFDAAPAALWIAAACTGAWTLAESEAVAHGWLAKDILLEVATSRVPNAGRGVFARQDIEAGVTIGAYPGRRLAAPSYYAKRERLPHFTEYCWVIEELQIALDPTDDATGILCEPLPRLGTAGPLLGSIETTLALINEPPPSADVNLATSQDGKALLISTARFISKGEELYLDCAVPRHSQSTPSLLPTVASWSPPGRNFQLMIRGSCLAAFTP